MIASTLPSLSELLSESLLLEYMQSPGKTPTHTAADGRCNTPSSELRGAEGVFAVRLRSVCWSSAPPAPPPAPPSCSEQHNTPSRSEHSHVHKPLCYIFSICISSVKVLKRPSVQVIHPSALLTVSEVLEPTPAITRAVTIVTIHTF